MLNGSRKTMVNLCSVEVSSFSCRRMSSRARNIATYVSRTDPLRNGDPDRIRTCDPQIRNLVLYPAELRDLLLLITKPGKISMTKNGFTTADRVYCGRFRRLLPGIEIRWPIAAEFNQCML